MKSGTWKNYQNRWNYQHKQQKCIILKWNLALCEIVEVKSVKRIKNGWSGLLEDKYTLKSKNIYSTQENLGP